MYVGFGDGGRLHALEGACEVVDDLFFEARSGSASLLDAGHQQGSVAAGEFEQPGDEFGDQVFLGGLMLRASHLPM